MGRKRALRRSIRSLAPLALAAGLPPVVPLALDEPAAVFDEWGGPITWDVLVGTTSVWLMVGLAALTLRLYACRFSPTAQRAVALFSWASAGAWLIHLAGLVARGLERPGPLPWWAGPSATVAGALLAGATGWFVVGRGPAVPITDAPATPGALRVDPGAEERAVWARSLFSPVALAGAAVLTVAGAVGVAADGLGLVDVFVAGLAVSTGIGSWARIRVDRSGIVITQPVLGRALVSVDRARIVHAWAEDRGAAGLPLTAYGVFESGRRFGYRTRSRGPVLCAEVSDGRRLVVTVNCPYLPAALVNTELDRWRIPGQRTG